MYKSLIKKDVKSKKQMFEKLISLISPRSRRDLVEISVTKQISPRSRLNFCTGTVENSPNPSSVYIRICKHREKVFYCFYKISFPVKKSKTLFFKILIKTQILTSREVLYTKLVRVISPCFAKKMLSKIRIFLA